MTTTYLAFRQASTISQTAKKYQNGSAQFYKTSISRDALSEITRNHPEGIIIIMLPFLFQCENKAGQRVHTNNWKYFRGSKMEHSYSCFQRGGKSYASIQ